MWAEVGCRGGGKRNAGEERERVGRSPVIFLLDLNPQCLSHKKADFIKAVSETM